MARISRKGREADYTHQSTIKQQYMAGSYSRLSNEDGKKNRYKKTQKYHNKDGESLTNQKKLIEDFAAQNSDIKLIREYQDNGSSGSNFRRNGFEQMMEDIRAGIINCIIVKDLSRFGRDFIETGNYIEKVFPDMGVRFIAINDNYDTNHPECTAEYLVLALKNLVNEMYAKDISKKIQTVKHLQQERGEYVGNCPPYGYKLNESNRKKLIIDEESAQVVKKIFELREKGMTFRKIAQNLQDNECMAPSTYLKQMGYHVNTPCRKESQWHAEVVSRMLSNEVYIGTLVQRKSVTSLYDNKKCEYLPKEERILIQDCHEAIIGNEQFKCVNAMKNTTANDKNSADIKVTRSENIVKGLLFCGDCGYAMSRKGIFPPHQKRPDGEGIKLMYAYSCKKYNTLGKAYCSSKHIMDTELIKILSAVILFVIRQIFEFKEMNCSMFTQLVKAQEKVLKKEKTEIQNKMNQNNQLKAELYENYANGILAKKEYLLFYDQYEKENTYLKKNSALLQNKLTLVQKERKEVNLFFHILRKNENNFEVTADLIKNLVEKIEIYDHKRIKISFHFADLYQRLRGERKAEFKNATVKNCNLS